VAHPGSGVKASSSFFEKKAEPARREPKNFCLLWFRTVLILLNNRQEPEHKSFLLLFFKKEVLAFLASPMPANLRAIG
jgi:hypothetical protein